MAPNAPVRLSFMISRARSRRALLPMASAVSARPSRWSPRVRKASQMTARTPMAAGGPEVPCGPCKPCCEKPQNEAHKGEIGKCASHAAFRDGKTGG